MKLDKEKFNWFGLDHDKVRKHYGDLDGNLEYVGSFCIENQYRPMAVYRAPNPDHSKGHKEYVLFGKDPLLMTMFVTGRDAEQMEPYRKQVGIYCQLCNEVLYSTMRHDCRTCTCGSAMIDGGRDYTRRSALGDTVEIDLLTGEVRKI